MINIAIGIFLLDYSRSQAFNIFIIVSLVGSLMFITLHITYNLLPMICKKRQKGMCILEPRFTSGAPESKPRVEVNTHTVFTLIPMPLSA